MSLFAIGDLHLAHASDKKMEIFGDEWKNHTQKIEDNWKKTVGPEDTVVLTGDHSWGRKLADCTEDLEFIINLPGRKIMLRGNHDMFWDPKKTARLNELFSGRLEFLQDNYYMYKDIALVGTKGYCFEGRDTPEHFKKIFDREIKRLRISFEAARADGHERFIMFLHFPPTSVGEMESGFTRMAEEYGAEQVIYSHCHGQARFDDSIKGEFHGTGYRLVSSDYLKFMPQKIAD